jgi:ligand-binding SRPBCC domain-containing protein
VRRSRFERTTRLRAPLGEVFDFFSSPENLGRITPPEMRFRIVEGPGRKLREGDRIKYTIRVMGVPVRWTTRIVEWRDGEAFADLQEKGPYAYWLHTHSFREVDGLVEMRDVVEYELPLGLAGRLVAGWLVRRQIEAIFEYRAKVMQTLFEQAD